MHRKARSQEATRIKKGKSQPFFEGVFLVAVFVFFSSSVLSAFARFIARLIGFVLGLLMFVSVTVLFVAFVLEGVLRLCLFVCDDVSMTADDEDEEADAVDETEPAKIENATNLNAQ
jgi:hypothetical protein